MSVALEGFTACSVQLQTFSDIHVADEDSSRIPKVRMLSFLQLNEPLMFACSADPRLSGIMGQAWCKGVQSKKVMTSMSCMSSGIAAVLSVLCSS